MAQQTAIQKLFTNLESIDIKVPQGIKDVYLQMEKGQIVQSYNDGYKDGQTDPDRSKDISEFSNAKLYYNETFKKL